MLRSAYNPCRPPGFPPSVGLGSAPGSLASRRGSPTGNGSRDSSVGVPTALAARPFTSRFPSVPISSQLESVSRVRRVSSGQLTTPVRSSSGRISWTEQYPQVYATWSGPAEADNAGTHATCANPPIQRSSGRRPQFLETIFLFTVPGSNIGPFCSFGQNSGACFGQQATPVSPRQAVAWRFKV